MLNNHIDVLILHTFNEDTTLIKLQSCKRSFFIFKWS